MEHIIEVEHYKKSYGSVAAVKDMNFYVEPGKLFAFLGPNGAGKSTTINALCTFLKPDGGKITVNGYELGKQDDKIRESIGTVFQESLLDERLTVKENLELRGGFYHMSGQELAVAIRRAVRVAEVDAFLNRPYGRLSGGQRRRADIARALLHTPKILFLDEPTTGLDPQTRNSIWHTIRKLQKETGMTVFLTTHYMQEAEDADYCIIVDDGQVTEKGTPYSLKERFAKDKLQLKWRDKEQLLEKLKRMGIDSKVVADHAEVKVTNTMECLPILTQCQDMITGFEVICGSMDDVFLNVTGKEIRE